MVAKNSRPRPAWRSHVSGLTQLSELTQSQSVIKIQDSEILWKLKILVSFRRKKTLTFTTKSVSFEPTDTLAFLKAVTHKLSHRFMLSTSCSFRRTSNILECGFFFGCSFIGCGIGWRIISWLILGWRQVVLASFAS